MRDSLLGCDEGNELCTVMHALMHAIYEIMIVIQASADYYKFTL